MWIHEASIETSAAPDRIWSLFIDVPGWKHWNAGIDHIELFGDFAKGSTFAMQPPGGDAFVSTLIDVKENEGFTDETVVDGTRVVVAHCLLSLASGGTRITYRTQVDGPAAEEFGPMVTADFADVLQALKALAERTHGTSLKTPQALDTWHRLVRSQDASGLSALLAEDAVFLSPIIHTPQHGRKLAAWYLGAAFQVFFNPTFRYVREIVGAADAMLEFETEIDGVRVNGVDIIKWNDIGQITEFKVMLRPMKAIHLIQQKMAGMLQASQAQP